jgi:hypothetical protein
MDAAVTPPHESDLDALSEVADSMKVVSERGFGARAPYGGWAMPPNIERAASHCKRPAKPKLRTAPVAAKQESTMQPARPSAALRMIRDHSQLVDAIRDRVDELGMTRLELDHQAGLQSGYSGKLLSRNHIKGFGKVSLGPTLGALGCVLILIEDPAQTARIKARMQPRQRPVVDAG